MLNTWCQFTNFKTKNITKHGYASFVMGSSSPLHHRPDGFVEQPASQEKTDRQQGRRAGEEEEEEERGGKDEEDDEGNGSSGDSEDDESDLFVNTNRPDCHYSESEEDEDGDSDEEEEKEEEEKEEKKERTEACSEEALMRLSLKR